MPAKPDTVTRKALLTEDTNNANEKCACICNQSKYRYFIAGPSLNCQIEDDTVNNDFCQNGKVKSGLAVGDGEISTFIDAEKANFKNLDQLTVTCGGIIDNFELTLGRKVVKQDSNGDVIAVEEEPEFSPFSTQCGTSVLTTPDPKGYSLLGQTSDNQIPASATGNAPVFVCGQKEKPICITHPMKTLWSKEGGDPPAFRYNYCVANITDWMIEQGFQVLETGSYDQLETDCRPKAFTGELGDLIQEFRTQSCVRNFPLVIDADIERQGQQCGDKLLDNTKFVKCPPYSKYCYKNNTNDKIRFCSKEKNDASHTSTISELGSWDDTYNTPDCKVRFHGFNDKSWTKNSFDDMNLFMQNNHIFKVSKQVMIHTKSLFDQENKKYYDENLNEYFKNLRNARPSFMNKQKVAAQYIDEEQKSYNHSGFNLDYLNGDKYFFYYMSITCIDYEFVHPEDTNTVIKTCMESKMVATRLAEKSIKSSVSGMFSTNNRSSNENSNSDYTCKRMSMKPNGEAVPIDVPCLQLGNGTNVAKCFFEIQENFKLSLKYKCFNSALIETFWVAFKNVYDAMKKKGYIMDTEELRDDYCAVWPNFDVRQPDCCLTWQNLCDAHHQKAEKVAFEKKNGNGIKGCGKYYRSANLSSELGISWTADQQIDEMTLDSPIILKQRYSNY